MKKINILFLTLVAFGILSCGKEDEIVDCFAQSLLLDAHHSASSDNLKQINFNITYYGDETLDNNVKWDFGDGTTQTANGVTTTHVYKNAGAYQAKATVTINGASCTYDLKEAVTVE